MTSRLAKSSVRIPVTLAPSVLMTTDRGRHAANRGHSVIGKTHLFEAHQALVPSSLYTWILANRGPVRGSHTLPPGAIVGPKQIGAMMDTSSAFHVDQAMEIGSYFSNRGHTKTLQWSNDNVPPICDKTNPICMAPIGSTYISGSETQIGACTRKGTQIRDVAIVVRSRC